METRFNIVADCQYYENYGAHDWDGEGECPTYWKAKGAHEFTVATDLTIQEVMELTQNPERIEELVGAVAPQDSDYERFGPIDWRFEERSEAAIQTYIEWVKARLADEPEDYGFVRYCAEGELQLSRSTVDWIEEQAKLIGLMTLEGNRYTYQTARFAG